MGYKNKTWLKESSEAPFFILEQGIYKGINVSSLGYVIGSSSDERIANKTKKYIVKLGPIVSGKTVVDNTIYDVACLDHINITQEDISSGKCVVMVAFLDTNPKNFYNSIHGFNKNVDDKLGTDKGVENILHDYRNGVIIGKLRLEGDINYTYIPTVSLSRKYVSNAGRYQEINLVSGEGFNPKTDMFWMYVYKNNKKKVKRLIGNYRIMIKKYTHPISSANPERPIEISWNGNENNYMKEVPSEWLGEKVPSKSKSSNSYYAKALTFEQVQELGEGLAGVTNNGTIVHLGFRVVRLYKGAEVPELGPMTYCRLFKTYSFKEGFHNADQDSRQEGEWDLEIHRQ